MTDNAFCFSHNPEVADARLDALKRGGKAPRKTYRALQELKIEDTKDVVSLLATTILEVRAGTAELRVANCIGYLSGHLIRAFEVSDFEERINKIEKSLRINS